MEHEWRYIENNMNQKKISNLNIIHETYDEAYVFYSKTLNAEDLRHSKTMSDFVEKAESSFLIKWTQDYPDTEIENIYWR